MCLAVPARVLEVRADGMGVVDHAGIKKEVSLLVIEDVEAGDYIIMHAGFAIHKIDEAAARETIEYLERLTDGMPSDNK